MRRVFVLMTRLVQHRIGLGPAFDRPRLPPPRSLGRQIVRQKRPQILQQFPAPLLRACCRDLWRVVVDGIQRPVEADSIQSHSMLPGGLPHQRPYQVVPDPMHFHFFVNHGGTLAAQHIHSQGPPFQSRNHNSICQRRRYHAASCSTGYCTGFSNVVTSHTSRVRNPLVATAKRTTRTVNFSGTNAHNAPGRYAGRCGGRCHTQSRSWGPSRWPRRRSCGRCWCRRNTPQTCVLAGTPASHNC